MLLVCIDPSQTEARYKELVGMGVKVKLLCIGRKASTYFKRRPQYEIEGNFSLGNTPTARDAQMICDKMLSNFVTQTVDKVRAQKNACNILTTNGL